YAVVQIGSMILRSECITTRSVVSAETGAGAPPASATARATHATSSDLVRLMGHLLAWSRSGVGDKTTDGAKLSTPARCRWWENPPVATPLTRDEVIAEDPRPRTPRVLAAALARDRAGSRTSRSRSRSSPSSPAWPRAEALPYSPSGGAGSVRSP